MLVLAILSWTAVASTAKEPDEFEEIRHSMIYAEADEIYVCTKLAPKKGSAVPDPAGAVKAANEFRWTFIEPRRVIAPTKAKIIAILKRNSFTRVVIKLAFEIDHFCLLFTYRDPARNFAIFCPPSYPTRVGYLYRFARPDASTVVLTEELSGPFLAMGLEDLVSEPKEDKVAPTQQGVAR